MVVSNGGRAGDGYLLTPTPISTPLLLTSSGSGGSGNGDGGNNEGGSLRK